MKHIVTGLFAVLVANLVTAQNGLIIKPGAQLTMSGNATLTLQNANLISNGTFEPGNGSVRMTGTAGFNDKPPPVGGGFAYCGERYNQFAFSSTNTTLLKSAAALMILVKLA